MSRTRAVAALASLVVLSACSSAAAAGPGATLLLSRPTGLGALPVAGDNHSFAAARTISGDGRFVVFVSVADDLGALDADFHVWVRDTFSDTTALVDRAPGGAPGDGGVAAPAISRDGSTICFISRATNLEPGVTGSHVYVVTRSSGATVVADRGDTAVGEVGNNTAGDCALDATGGHVAFTTNASNLVGSDTNGRPDVFVRDLGTSTTKRVSVSSTGAQSPNGGNSAAITAAGTKVAFATSSQLVPADITAFSDVYVRDTAANATKRVSVGTGGVEADGSSFDPSISDDGLTVAFASRAQNLAGGPDDNDKSDVFVRLISADTTFAASRANTSAGALGDGDSEAPSISGDGLGVAFASAATNLGAGAPPGDFARWIYFRRFSTDTTTLLSRAGGAAGAPADGSSGSVSLNTDRTAASWDSVAGNLDAAASGEFLQVYKRELGGGEETTLVSRPDGTGARSSLVNASVASGPRAMSADGRRVVMTSESDSLDPAGAGRLQHIYVRDTLANTTTLVDRAAGGDGAVANDVSHQASISADGRRVAFTSDATNLLPGGNPPGAFIRDLETNELFLVSRKDGANGDPLDLEVTGGMAPAMNANGTRVAFVSDFTAVDSGDTNNEQDVWVRDLAAGTTTLASVGPSGIGNSRSNNPAMSADGSRVAFNSISNNLVGESVPTVTHVYVRDLAAGTTLLADRSGSDGSPGSGGTATPEISADGNRVLFAASAALTPEPVPAGGGVYVRDLAAQTTTLASRADGASGAAVPNGFLQTAAFSQDGQHVAFTGFGPDVSGAPPSGQPQVYVRDLGAQTTTLVSAADGTPATIANSPAFFEALSGDGGCAAFSTVADNLTVPDYGTRDFVQTYLRVVSGECPKPPDGPGPGPAPPGPGPGAPPDVTPPQLGTLVLSARKFKAARRVVSVAARRRTPTGTRVTFRLSEAASVRFTVERAQAGRRVGRRCVRPSRKNRKRRKCTRFVLQRGSFRVAGKAGRNRFRFTGRLARRKLRPGVYRLVAVATDAAGNKSARRRASFKIVRR